MEPMKPMTFERMEPEYNIRALRPDYNDQVVPRWNSQSAQFRQHARGEIDLAYGDGERERVDVFRAQTSDAALVVYFHGGYWQRGDKSVYSFLAEPYVENGVAFAVVNYPLCPTVSITNLVGHTRKSIIWLWDNAERLGYSPDRIFVMGHSAGGHITGMLMATDWPSLRRDLPQELIKGGIPLSALNDLEPLLLTSVNEGVRMDSAEAKAQSPMAHPPVTNAPQLVVCGDKETSEFHRQSDIYANAFTTNARSVERYSVPDCDHFDLLDVLAKQDSPFFQKTLRLIRGRVEELQEKSVSETLEEIVSAFNAHDVPRVLACFADDGEMLLPAGPESFGARLKGKEQIAAALERRFKATPDIQWVDGQNWIQGDKGVSEWRVTWTSPDGKANSIQGCDLYEFTGAKVARKNTFYKQKT